MQEDVGQRVLRASEDIRASGDGAGIPLRLVGSYAVRMHCPAHAEFLDRLQRETVNDLDFVSERKFARDIQRIFESLGYVGDKRLEQASDGQQRYFVHPETRLGVDVYLGSMNYCHPIDMEGRLESDPTTVPLAELLLSKLQIVELTEKDIKDVLVLLLAHDVGPGDTGSINVDRIADVLAHDWGFHHTVTTNLATIEQHLPEYPVLTDEERVTVGDRIDRLRRRIEAEPKDRRWKLRAKVGTRVRWYQAVEEK